MPSILPLQSKGSVELGRPDRAALALCESGCFPCGQPLEGVAAWRHQPQTCGFLRSWCRQSSWHGVNLVAPAGDEMITKNTMCRARRPCAEWTHQGRGKAYFPAAFLRALLILSCHPGPSSWKKSKTSRSMRRVNNSFAPGTEDFLGAGSAGLVVAFLKAASAVVHEPLVARVRSGGFGMGVSPPGSDYSNGRIAIPQGESRFGWRTNTILYEVCDE